jgi:enterochelin esterase-like enzyme
MKTWTKRGWLLAGLVLAATLLPARAAGPYKASKNKQDAASAPRGQRVFFAAHSLMWYVPKPLGEMVEAAGIKDHKLVGVQSLGASRTLQHWNLPEGRNRAKQALEKGDVDVFVMSPIQFPDQGIENFVKLGLKHNPKMRFTVQISWGAWDIDNQDFPKGATFKVDRNKTPDQLKKLYERNIKAAEVQADEINKKVGKKVLFLVPSAQAVVTLRTRIYNKEMPGLTTQAELFRDPISHPTPPLEALNTYLHLAMIYGKSPVGLPMPAVLKKANKEAWNEKMNRALQEIAWETVTSYVYSGVKQAEKPKPAGPRRFGAIKLNPDDKPAFDDPPAGFDKESKDVPHGKLEMVSYDSKSVGTKRKMHVYTPPGYSRDKKYPVLYLLHGIGGDETEWQRFAKPSIVLDNLLAKGKITPMIVVMPNGRAQKNDRAEGNIFASAPAFAAFEKDLLSDVIPAIEARYSVNADREHRAIAGLSMGGGQALNFGLGHLDTFAWVGAFSAAPNTKRVAQLVPDPASATKKLKLLYLSCGKKDGLIWVSQGVHAYLKEKKVPHVWHVDGNGHDPTHWKNNLYLFSQRIFR